MLKVNFAAHWTDKMYFKFWFSTTHLTVHFKRKKLVTNSPRKSEHVLDTINQNWFCPWGPFCCRSSYLHIKPTRGHWALRKCIKSKNRNHFVIPIFGDLQLCTLVPGWLEHFKGPKNAPCLWFGHFSSRVKHCRRVS